MPENASLAPHRPARARAIAALISPSVRSRAVGAPLFALFFELDLAIPDHLTAKQICVHSIRYFAVDPDEVFEACTSLHLPPRSMVTGHIAIR